MQKPLAALLFLLFSAVSGLAAAADATPRPNIVFSAGAINVFHHGAIQDTAATIDVQYRWGQEYWYVSPLAGAFISSDGSAMAFGGVYHDFRIGTRWTITPLVAAGLYRRGSGSDLGGAFQFYSGIDFMYRLDNDWRVGLSARHISNLGINSRNPGTELLMLVLAVPLK